MQHAVRYLYLSLVFLLFSFSSYAQCEANITPRGTVNICNGDQINLKANEGIVDADLRYRWFRNGAVISGANAQTYSTALGGEYKVEVSSAAGVCVTSTSEATTVIPKDRPILPNFTREPTTQPCSGQPVVLKVLQQQPDVIYIWNFGDGTLGRGAEVTHTYSYIGADNKSFNVKVVATLNGCLSDTARQSITIGGQPNFTEASVTDSADFQICVPKDSTINHRAKLFNNIADPASVTEYIVDFGDGAGPQTYLPGDFTATDSIRNTIPYTKQGSYPITIRAVGFNGCDAVVTKTYEISQKPTADFQIPPENKKRVDPAQCVPVTVAVADSSKGGDLTYKWSVQNNQGQPASGVTYIDGTTDTSPQPKFQFAEQGRFQIQLIVENPCGTDTTSQSVLIAYPEVQMSLDSTSCGPVTIKFNDQMVTYDANLGTEVPSSFQWVISGPRATFVAGTTANSKYPEITFPTPGVYNISVSFANECGNSKDVAQPGSASATVTVYEVPRAPTVTASVPAICAGDSAVIQPTGPAGNQFNFYDTVTGGTPLGTGATYNTGPLEATTTFYITTLNANNCESPGDRTPYAITVYPRLENNTIAEDQEVCQGSATAEITGTQPTGGTGNNYIYRWLRSTTGPDGAFTAAPGVNNGRNYTPPALSQNSWFRRVVTSAACSGDTSNVVALTITPRIAGNTISADQQVCANETVATLIGNPITGGKPGAVTFEWRSNTIGENAAFLPAANTNTEENYEPGLLNQTTWFRRYVISGGCVDSSNVVRITVDQLVTNNSISADQELCDGVSPAPLTGTLPQGGTLPIRYRWESSTTSATAGFSPAFGINNRQNFNPQSITVTTWFRRAVISGGCEPDYSNVVQISVLPAITNNTISTPETEVCEATVPQTITGTAPSGGNDTYTYLWESSITSATAAFAPAAGTNNQQNYTPPVLTRNTWFRRTVISGGCSNISTTVELKVNKLPPVPVVEAASVTACQDSTATLVATAPGGRYQWFETATGGNILFEGATFVTPPISKTTTFYVQTVNQNECASATRTPVTVNVITITASAGRDTTIIEGNTMELIGRGGVRYKWEPATGLNDPNVERPVASPTKTTTYKVTAYSEEGCAATDEVTITVIPRVIIVNTFSPNRDGINEVWEIQRIENYPEATVEIFNRWGTQVFKSTDGYKQAWDGKHNGQDLPLATYYYIIRLDKISKPISGNVTIVR